MIKKFKDEPPRGAHADFQAWRERWPDGFFLNVLSSSKAMLHRIACGHLESPTKELAGDWNLTKRQKVCSRSTMLLDAWAMRNGLIVSRCQDCQLPEKNALDIAVACADIGSVAKGKFGWALKLEETWSQGDGIVDFSEQIAHHLNQNTPVAVGFECPLFVPLPRDPMRLTRARNGERNRAWCAGAGSGALAVGLTEIVWILREVCEGLDVPEKPAVSLRWPQFLETGGLFIWEAFVTGASKQRSHIQDAKSAVEAFARALPNPERKNLVHEETVYSLGGAALLRAGWEVPNTILEDSTLVIAAEHGPTSELAPSLRASAPR